MKSMKSQIAAIQTAREGTTEDYNTNATFIAIAHPLDAIVKYAPLVLNLAKKLKANLG